jgi:hypothetical protein
VESQTLNILADAASIISLLLVIYNAFQITAVKRRIVLNVTLDPLLNRLQEGSREMNYCLLNYQATVADLDVVMSMCEADVRALIRRFGVRRGGFCKSFLTILFAYRRRKSEDGARAVYAALQRVIREASNRAEELRITGS